MCSSSNSNIKHVTLLLLKKAINVSYSLRSQIFSQYISICGIILNSIGSPEMAHITRLLGSQTLLLKVIKKRRQELSAALTLHFFSIHFSYFPLPLCRTDLLNSLPSEFIVPCNAALLPSLARPQQICTTQEVEWCSSSQL